MKRLIVISAALAILLSFIQAVPVLQGSPQSQVGTDTPTPGPTNTPTPRSAQGGTIGMGQSVSGSISRSGQQDTWSFQGTMGQLVIITMEASGARSLDPYLELWDSTGVKEAFNADSPPGVNARIAKRLAKNDVYTIVAKDYLARTMGSYVLRLTNPSYLPTLPFGPSVNGNIDTPGFSDLYTFPGTYDQSVIITLDAAPGSKINPYLELVNPEGSVEATTVPSATATNQILAKHLLMTGAYTVVARDSWAANSGAYVLGLVSPTGATPTPTPPPTATPSPTPTAVPTGTPAPATVAEALRSIDGNYTMVWSFDNSTGAWKFYNALNPKGATITKLEPWKAYWISVTQNCTLVVGANNIPLYTGWNLVGWGQ